MREDVNQRRTAIRPLGIQIFRSNMPAQNAWVTKNTIAWYPTPPVNTNEKPGRGGGEFTPWLDGVTHNKVNVFPPELL